jgi:hypothetical protein
VHRAPAAAAAAAAAATTHGELAAGGLSDLARALVELELRERCEIDARWVIGSEGRVRGPEPEPEPLP